MSDYARYFPASEGDTPWGVSVRACGRSSTPPGASYPPEPGRHPPDHLFRLPRGRRSLDTFQFLYLSSGRGKFETALSKPQPVQPGDALLLFPGIWHRYAPAPSTGWTEHWIELRGPVIDRLLQSKLLDAAAPLCRPGLRPETIDAFAQIRRLATRLSGGAQAALGTLALHILAILLTRPTPEKEDPAARAIRHAEARMRERPGCDLRMPDLARDAGMPYDAFRRAFRQHTGLAPHQYHRRIRMRRAEILLLHTGWTLQRIADELEFDSAFHFSTAFKIHSGEAPSHWRQSRAEARK